MAANQRCGILNYNAAPSYWPPAPLMVHWPSLFLVVMSILCTEEEMFGFHDKAAFCKNIGDPKTTFMLTISFSSLCVFPAKPYK